ncbi:UDP-N-acetylmuramoylalanine--D-glutamate ligase-like isoform X3 [Macadamia integrifolia]|uniref:UDP-N-acetylmuramoylalanine--D-glutamate ligase-like isoform X3 n=1 Tax=Macadamia integrifolia TaxID=60698 RepID=UPI001C528FE5|nr:UDP-N-acetylmuramoylalanine--D-glutamate ligase-like isoform X3 [Macadamia integrifolia]
MAGSVHCQRWSKMNSQLLTNSHRLPTSTTFSLARTSISHGRILDCYCIQEKQDLKGQTVAVVGLGVSGRAAARLALARGASVLAIDRNENMIPLEHDPLFEKQNDMRTILGYCDRKLLEDADRVVVSPGVPLENYGISSLLQSGRWVMSELDFAAEALPHGIKVLAVTGTNGKSTVTTFAGQMLSHLGIKAFVGGNLGNPLSEAAIQCLTSSSVDPKFQVAVVEVSSYQMEIPNTFFCPSVGVVLNLTPDHLERHKTMDKYATAKCRLFSNMNNKKLAVLPIGNEHLNEAFKDHVNKCNLAWIGDFPGVKIDLEAKIAYLKIPSTGVVTQLQLGAMKAMGTHNDHNAAVAAFSILGLDVGINPEAISTTLNALSAPPHRMQIVHRDSRGITWVDDSKATNVEATYAGLMGLREQKSVVLLGGLAKVLNTEGSNGFEKLVEPLKYHRCVITKFGSSGTEIQKTLLAGGLSIPCHRARSMENAVNLAMRVAGYGDAIVLSPGCASFDEFRSFEHRGKVFQDLAFSSQ